MAKKRGSAGGNAFDVLMKKKPKTPKSSQTSSRFVDCPAGCGSHIPEHQVNQHLDNCLGSSEQKTEVKSDASQSENVHRSDCAEDEQAVAPPSDSKPAAAAASNASNPSQPSPQPSSDELLATVSQSPDSGPNAFSHMMKQSHRVFSSKEPLQQRFHVHSDGRLTWTDMDENNSDTAGAWSAKVLLKASRMNVGESSSSSHNANAPPLRDVELTISSSIIPTATEQTRLVKRHSRLSVPVLKSILQKSIRRRRPLPAVRVAMELMDKAMGELLRRLPIIILEDSMLHPDLPLLVWAMVAESKDYVIPPQLMTRILCVVYEMASCPWTDYVDNDKSHARARDANETILLSAPIPFFREESNVAKGDECEMLLRSMLLRAQYGGMAGDMKMLRDYVHLWSSRFRQGSVPDGVAQRVRPAAPSLSELKWIDVPTAVHERLKAQSHSRVSPLVQAKLNKLSVQDICLAGVDFHCSSVLDHAIRHDSEFERCYQSLCAIVIPSGLSPPPADKDKRRPYLMQVMKTCMWEYSSGINLRRPLCSDAAKERDPKDAALKSFWDENLVASVEAYMKNYVESRLA